MKITKLLMLVLFILLTLNTPRLFCEEIKDNAQLLNQKEIDTLYYEAYLSDKLGQKDEANIIYDKISAYYLPTLNNPSADKIEKLRAFKEVVKIQTKQEDFENALRTCTSLSNEYPDEVIIFETEAEVHHLYGTYHLSQRDFDRALGEYEDILNVKKLSPQWSAFAKDYMAYIYLCEGDSDKALYWYNRIIEDHPDLKQWPASAHYSVGQYYLSQDDNAKAKQEFQIIITKYPDSDWAIPAQEALRSLK